MKYVFVGLLVAFVAGCAGTRNGAGIIPSASQSSQTMRAASPSRADVVGTVPSLAAIGARDLGRAPANDTLSLSLTLRYRNEGQLEALVARQADSASADYHHWLNNARFNARYAPSAADYARTVASLKRNGFHILKAYANRTVVDATGSVASVERYFGTSIHRVAQRAAAVGYVNVSPARAPADLHGVLLSVDGLDTLALVRTASSTPAGKKSTFFGPVSSATQLQGYGPLAFGTAYNFPVMHGYDGKGRTTGVVIDADYQDSDLAAFLKYFGVTRDGPATQRVPIDGGAQEYNNPDSVEATLDVETIVSNAPGTALYVYEMPTLQLKNITDAYNAIVSDNVVDVVNSSFGGCDAGFKSSSKAWNAIALQGAAKGITFSASSGDDGGGLCASAPASSPNFVAVGGTALRIDPGDTAGFETGWGGNGALGSGGGISTVFPTPKWQRNVAGIDPRGRNVPDIAFDAAPYTGTALYILGTWNTGVDPEGGTSLSSPLFVAAATEFGQMKNGRVGLSSQQVFLLWKKIGYGSSKTPYFHDITIGSSGPFYCARGYDLVTGIGSLDTWNVAGKL